MLRALVLLLLSFALVARPALAQDQVLRDAETEKFFRDISLPLLKAAGLDPSKVQLILLGDRTINAGTVLAATSVGELQGVIAHEFGHLAGGHVPLSSSNTRGSTNISLLSLLVGAAAVAAGAGAAGMAAMGLGQTAAMGKYLAFSRAQESAADAAAIRYMRDAHISGRGMVSFFGKLRSEEYRLSPSYAKIDPYMQDHPMSADRQEALSGDVKASPWYDVPDDPAQLARLKRLQGKLNGFLLDPPDVLKKYPESQQTEAAMYARAYAWHRGAYPDRAVQEVDRLVALHPHDPYYLELKGQILLESGKPAAAVPPLREAVARADNAPLIASLLGHALLATEDAANFPEAQRVLKLSLARDEENPFAWYALGTVYARQGDEARAQMATAERYSLMNQPQQAMMAAEYAMRGLPQGTPDYLRAQDIALASRTMMQEKRRR